jgi:hypothetical protein
MDAATPKPLLTALTLLILAFVPLAGAQNTVWWKWIRVDYTAADGVIHHGTWGRSDAYDSGRDCRWSFPNHGQMASMGDRRHPVRGHGRQDLRPDP